MPICVHPWGCTVIITGRNEVLAKVIFLHLSVIHSVHGEGGVPDQAPPPRPDRNPSPRDQAGTSPLRTRQVPPQDQTPPGTRHPPDPPRTRHPPPGEADTGIRSTIGRYASYWNAFLFSMYGTSQEVYRNGGKRLHLLVGVVEYCECQNAIPVQNFQPITFGRQVT